MPMAQKINNKSHVLANQKDKLRKKTYKVNEIRLNKVQTKL